MGLYVLRTLCQQHVDVPVIFLTSTELREDEHLALDAGARDFVHKSRGVTILAQRVRIVLWTCRRRRQPQAERSEDVLRYGRLTLKPAGCRALWKGVDLHLTLTEFMVMELLVQRAGAFVSTREIYDHVRCPGFAAGDGAGGYRTNMRSLMRRLRNKFRAIDDTFVSIWERAKLRVLLGGRGRRPRCCRQNSMNRLQAAKAGLLAPALDRFPQPVGLRARLRVGRRSPTAHMIKSS